MWKHKVIGLAGRIENQNVILEVFREMFMNKKRKVNMQVLERLMKS